METRKNCCFNHKIGLPQKDGIPFPIFQWQKDIYDAYEGNMYNWILKATGLGLTEFTLRYILWKCTTSSQWGGSLVSIITGPRIDLARESINRMKDMIINKYPISGVTQERFLINNVSVGAFPSNHLAAFRGVPSVKFIFLDEADFFEKKEQYEVRDISERYIAKSNPQILMVSTPNRPGGLMERIQEESNSIYNKLLLPYTIGIGTMFTMEQIESNMLSPSFEREYDLKYLGEIGNIFNPQDIITCTHDLGEQYNPIKDSTITDPTISHFLGVDPGFGSSMFGLCVVQLVNGFIEVVYSEHIERGSISECLDTVLKLAQKHRVYKIYVDGSAPGFIRDIKKHYGENLHYEEIIRDNPEVKNVWIHSKEPRVVPINFRERHRDMLMSLEGFIQKHLIRIHPCFTKLGIALRTATSKDDKYNLDKEKTSHDDLLDALMLSLLGFYLSP